MISRQALRAAVAVALSFVAVASARAQSLSPSAGALLDGSRGAAPHQPGLDADADRVRLQPDADPAADEAVPSFGQLFTGTLRNFKQLPTRANVGLLALGGIAALATHPADAETSRAVSGSTALDEPLKAGAFLGGTPFELGAAFATYGLGRAFGNGRVARVGADLVQAQLMAEVLTMGIKEATRRARPSGSGFSFPSGHTAVTFASATVLQRNFGWKIGIPAYIIATYVGTSRIHDKRHYLSDVAFGAALGTVAGRTVPINRRHGIGLSLAPVAGGGAIVVGIRQ